jgi:hypothetical protein
MGRKGFLGGKVYHMLEHFPTSGHTAKPAKKKRQAASCLTDRKIIMFKKYNEKIYEQQTFPL